MTTPTNRGVGAAGLALRSVRLDIALAWRHVLRNVVGGSVLLPRVARAVVYRLCGYRFQTANIAEAQILLIEPRWLTIGRDVAISRGCYFEGSGEVHIGAGTLVGQQVAFITSAHRLTTAGAIDRNPTYRNIAVGEKCWIGARATILGGTTLEDGCVVAAGSVVSSHCKAGYLYAGVPAKKIGRALALAALPD